MPWTAKQRAILRKRYPGTHGKKLVPVLGHALSSIYREASRLGLKKSPAFLKAELVRQRRRLRIVGVRHRFPKGHAPANKGLRRPGWHSGRMRETQFKKGCFPQNRDPDFYVVGALRVNTDGYIDMRISFDKGARGWRGLHLILWEDAHGPLPKSHCLRFKDGDRLNVCLENLELITRRDNMARNCIHNLPAPLKSTIQLLGQLNRRIHEEQDRRSAQSSFCDAGGSAR